MQIPFLLRRCKAFTSSSFGLLGTRANLRFAKDAIVRTPLQIEDLHELCTSLWLCKNKKLVFLTECRKVQCLHSRCISTVPFGDSKECKAFTSSSSFGQEDVGKGTVLLSFGSKGEMNLQGAFCPKE